jgi:hypothetical protein
LRTIVAPGRRSMLLLRAAGAPARRPKLLFWFSPLCARAAPKAASLDE